MVKIIRPKPAATLIITKIKNKKLHILMGKRPDEARFAPGMWVFPGGKLDKNDLSTLKKYKINNRMIKNLKLLRAESRLGEALIHTAIRETQEECGVNVPIDMIDKKEHYYSFISRQHKFKKIVTYFIVKVDSLSQIGLDSIIIPKGQLQIEEVQYGMFFDYEECLEVTSKSQLNVIYNIHSKSLI